MLKINPKKFIRLLCSGDEMCAINDSSVWKRKDKSLSDVVLNLGLASV